MRRYPAYKASGVEWLGEVPEGWPLSPLKHVADFVNGAAFKPDTWSEAGTPIIRIENLNGGTNFNCYEGDMNERYLVQQGDILFGWSGNIGTSFGPFIWNTPGRYYLNQHIFNIQRFSCDRKWFYWCLRAVTFYVELKAHGIIGMVHVTKGDLGEINIPLPPLTEQRAIAAFLDQETAKIDALVAEQRRLIDLLREKRQAVISHAVTRGLNPKAPLKPSGIDWLGDVPEGWEVNKFSRLIAIAEGQVDPEKEPYASMILIAPNHIESGTGRIIALETAADQGAESGKYMFEAGAVIYSKIRPALAKVVLAPSAGLCSADMYPLNSRGSHQHDYLAWLLLSPGFTAWAVLESDRVAMPKINREKLNELHLPVPPIAEQLMIVEFIRNQTAQLDTLTATAETAIALLQERRAALISAAVTGKIDVRALAPQTMEPA